MKLEFDEPLAFFAYFDFFLRRYATEGLRDVMKEAYDQNFGAEPSMLAGVDLLAAVVDSMEAAATVAAGWDWPILPRASGYCIAWWILYCPADIA